MAFKEGEEDKRKESGRRVVERVRGRVGLLSDFTQARLDAISQKSSVERKCKRGKESDKKVLYVVGGFKIAFAFQGRIGDLNFGLVNE